MNNAVIYARYSSTGQNEQTIEGQIRICKEYAEKHGLRVVKVYDKDKAKSASKETEKRKDLHKMFADAETGAFQHIIVYKLNRFARNRNESRIFKAELERHGVKVLSATEQITDDEGGELYEMILEWNDEKYSQRLSKVVHDGLDTVVENGTYSGGVLIYGYKLVGTGKKGGKGEIHKVEIDEEQAENVRFIFTEYANGTNKKAICDLLNARGEKYKNSTKFHFRNFDTMLSNTKYTGEFTLGERVSTTMYPQIIDKLLFDKVQKRLRENQILAGANSAVEPYLLTGKAECGQSGTAMIAGGGTSKTGKKHYYYVCKKKTKKQCNKKVENKDTLEMDVVGGIRNFLSKKANAEVAAQDTIDYQDKRTGDDGLKSIESKIAHTLTQVEEMTTRFIEAKSELLRANIEKRMSETEILLKDLQAERAQIVIERGAKLTKHDILDFIAELLQGNPNDKSYQKKLIDNLLYKVVVYDDAIIPYLNLRNGKEIERITLADTNNAITTSLGVQSLSGLVRPRGLEPPRITPYDP